jgi:hypothetical protein
MEHEDSLPCSQETALGPIQLNPVHITSHFFKIHINIILSSMPGPQSGLFPTSFPTKMWYALFC